MGESWASLPTRWWWRQTTDCRDAGESGVRADYGHRSWWRGLSGATPYLDALNSAADRDKSRVSHRRLVGRIVMMLEEREVNELIELGFEGGQR